MFPRHPRQVAMAPLLTPHRMFHRQLEEDQQVLSDNPARRRELEEILIPTLGRKIGDCDLKRLDREVDNPALPPSLKAKIKEYLELPVNANRL
jgi:hypothetical protein